MPLCVCVCGVCVCVGVCVWVCVCVYERERGRGVHAHVCERDVEMSVCVYMHTVLRNTQCEMLLSVYIGSLCGSLKKSMTVRMCVL